MEGASTLWVEGKIINHDVGDKDGAYGVQITLPISDIIIFKKRENL